MAPIGEHTDMKLTCSGTFQASPRTIERPQPRGDEMKNYVRRRAHWVVMSLILAVAACGGDPTGNGDDGGGGGGATTSVTVGNDFFSLSDIIVDSGETVTWTWAGGSPEPGHNVTFASDRIADSPTQTTGTYAVTMPNAPAVYSYMCTICQRRLKKLQTWRVKMLR